jgi:hypothetical protein
MSYLFRDNKNTANGVEALTAGVREKGTGNLEIIQEINC